MGKDYPKYERVKNSYAMYRGAKIGLEDLWNDTGGLNFLLSDIESNRQDYNLNSLQANRANALATKLRTAFLKLEENKGINQAIVDSQLEEIDKYCSTLMDLLSGIFETPSPSLKDTNRNDREEGQLEIGIGSPATQHTPELSTKTTDADLSVVPVIYSNELRSNQIPSQEITELAGNPMSDLQNKIIQTSYLKHEERITKIKESLDQFRQITKTIEHLRKAVDDVMQYEDEKKTMKIIAGLNKDIARRLDDEFGHLKIYIERDFSDVWKKIGPHFDELPEAVENLEECFSKIVTGIKNINDVMKLIEKKFDVLWDITIPHILQTM